LVVPVPVSAAEVSGGSSIGGRVDTGSIDSIVSSEAGEAVTGGLVEGVALGAHRSAEPVFVEVGPVSALGAGLSGPGPAEEVAVGDDRNIVVLEAGAAGDDVSVVAGRAGAVLIPLRAEVGDGGADLVSVEEPPLGALGADAVLPEGASNVIVRGLVDLGAFAVDDGVPLVALLADSLLGVELLAGALHLDADSVFIEEEAVGALQAGILAPHLAPEVVVERGQQRSVIQLLGRELHILGNDLSHQEQQDQTQGCF